MPTGIDELDASGIPDGEIKKSFSDQFVKMRGFAIKSVLFRAIALSSPEPYLYREVEQQGQIRREPSGHEAIETSELFQTQSPSVALIGEGGIRKAITQHNSAFFQSRSDNLCDMLTTSREN